MSIADFLARIESPRLLNVARHWLEARGARRMPGWRDIDPLAIAPELPIVWAWRYDRAAATFTGGGWRGKISSTSSARPCAAPR